MTRLASVIRDRMDALLDEYDRHMQEHPVLAEMPASFRREIERRTLSFVAGWLERSGDDAQFVQFIRDIVQERSTQGLDLSIMQCIVHALQVSLDPLITDVEAGKRVWRALSRTRDDLAHQATGTLLASEKRLRQMVDHSPSGIFRATAAGRVLDANPAFLDAIGYASLEAVNQAGVPAAWQGMEWFLPNAAPDTLNQIGLPALYENPAEHRRLIALLQQGPVIGFETSLRRADGRIIAVSMNARLVQDIEPYLEGILQDITERKRLEQQVEQSLERRGRQVQINTEIAQEIAAAPALDELFRRVVTLIKERFGYYHAQIFRYDPAHAGRAVALVAGYGAAGQAMLAAGHHVPMGRGVVGMAAHTARSVLAADVAQDSDWRPNPHLPETKGELAVPIKLRDEVLGILDVQSDRAGALTAEDQLLLEGLCGQIAVAIDQQRATEALKDSQARLRTLIESAAEAIMVLDADTGLFSDPNSNAERLFGLDRTALSRVGLVQVSPPTQPDGRPSVEAAGRYTAAALAGEQTVFEWVHVSAAGQSIPCEIRLARIPEAGRNLLRVSITDITERKQAEQALAEQSHLSAFEAEVGGIITQNIPLREKLQRSAQAAVEHLDAALARIWTLDPTSDMLELQASAGLYTHLNGPHGRISVSQYKYKIGVIASRREPHHTNSVETDPQVSDHAWAQREGLVAFAGYPLMASEQVFGVIAMFARRPLSERILDTLQAVSVEIALSIEREQAEARMQETLRELERLNRAATREGWQSFREAGQLASGYLYDRANVQPAGEIWSPQIEQAARQNTLVRPTAENAVAAAPLAVRGEVIGALGVYDDPQRPLSPDELALLQEILEQGALALESARLYEETQRRAAREQMTARITARIRESLDMQTVLTVAAEQMRQALGLEEMLIKLATPQAPAASPTTLSEREGVK